MFWWRGGPALRSPALAVLTAVILAVVLAIVLYYAHFLETYRTELSRIGSETAAAAPDAGGRGIGSRLAAVPIYLRNYYGTAAVTLALWGAAALWHRGARDRTTLACAGWTLACLLFLVIGILTPVDMRYYLAAIPVVAIAGALAAAFGWTSKGPRRVIAVLLLAWAAVGGVTAWFGERLT